MTSIQKINAIGAYSKLRSAMKWLPDASDDDVEDLYAAAKGVSELVGRDKILNDTAKDMFTKGRMDLDEIEYELASIAHSLKSLPWLITPTYNDLKDGDGNWSDMASEVAVKLKKLPAAKQKLMADLYKSKKLSLDELLYEIKDL